MSQKHLSTHRAAPGTRAHSPLQTCTGVYTHTYSFQHTVARLHRTNQQRLRLLWQSCSAKSIKRTKNSLKNKEKKLKKKNSERGALGERGDGKKSGFVLCTDLPVLRPCAVGDSTLYYNRMNKLTFNEVLFFVWHYIMWSVHAWETVSSRGWVSRAFTND